MRKNISDIIATIAGSFIVFSIRLYMKIRHPFAWREYTQEMYTKIKEAEERKVAKKNRFATNYTYGNDNYDDFLKNVQLIRHFSVGGTIVRSVNGIYCAVGKDFLKEKEIKNG